MIQGLTGQRASLEALQSDEQACPSDDYVREWLGKHGIEQTLPWVKAIVVDDGFEIAADMVLGNWLVALQAELTSLNSSTDAPPARLALLDGEPGQKSADPMLSLIHI